MLFQEDSAVGLSKKKRKKLKKLRKANAKLERLGEELKLCRAAMLGVESEEEAIQLLLNGRKMLRRMMKLNDKIDSLEKGL